MTPRKNTSMTRDEVALLLDEAMTGALVTLEPDGMPHVAAMWFVHDDDSLRMWTYRRSQKAVNLMRDPRVAFMAESGDDYAELRGVQVRGRAKLLTDVDEVAAIGGALYDRYTRPRTGMPLEGPVADEIVRQATKRIGIVLALKDVSSWDHRKL